MTDDCLAAATDVELQAELRRRKLADETPQTSWQTSDRVGSCNFCHRWLRVEARANASHRVLVVSSPGLMGLEVRICPQCLEAISRMKGKS